MLLLLRPTSAKDNGRSSTIVEVETARHMMMLLVIGDDEDHENDEEEANIDAICEKVAVAH